MPRPTLDSPLIHYPDLDGCPMPEGGFQFNSLTYAVMALRVHFWHRNDVYVAGNMFIYYEEGNGDSCIAPDVFVVFGAHTHTRSSYLIWEEAKGPDFVMEIASASTVERRPGVETRALCRSEGAGILAIRPFGSTSRAAASRFRVEDGVYVPLPASALVDGASGVYSSVLGLHVRMDGEMLRFHDPVIGQDLRTHEEEARAKQDAEARSVELEARLQTLQQSSHPRTGQTIETPAVEPLADSKSAAQAVSRELTKDTDRI